MTVVAYSSKHRVLAADSRCSSESGMHFTNMQKLFRLRNGALLGISGDTDTRDVRELLGRAAPGRMPSREKLAELKTEFEGILVFRSGRVFAVTIEHHEFANEGEWCGAVDEVRDPIVAVGHGAEFAYGAMEVGADPVRAVEAACRRDSACALPVQSEKL